MKRVGMDTYVGHEVQIARGNGAAVDTLTTQRPLSISVDLLPAEA